ncbi:MAG: sensor domain-containing diguanylate cyclase [Acidobacteria bacterium]|nr:sensor domain-containing diguanylate cyclase [Acidobacteriota bacterium]
MRFLRNRDVLLGLVLLAGVLVVVVQPLRPFLSVAEEFSSTYHVDLIPGFILLVVAYTAHFCRQRYEASIVARKEAWESEEIERDSAELKQLVATLQAFGNSPDANVLTGELTRLLQPFLKSRRCWVATSTSEGWCWLLEPHDKSDAWTLMNLARSFADPYEMDEPLPSDWYLVPLRTRGQMLGVLGVDKTQPMSASERSRADAVATVLAISIKNIQLLTKMRTLNESDALTGCFNRAYGFEALELQMRRSKRTQSRLAVLMLDVDDFKTINDKHGHLAGDRVLEAVGGTLRRSLRTTDIKCRYGGDEFLVVLLDTPLEAARSVAEHLRRACESVQVEVPGGRLSCKISVGVTDSNPGELDAPALVHRADEALYLDKSLRGRIQPRVKTGDTAIHAVVAVPSESA